MTALTPSRVRVPCSTSNLGAGFDCIGLALERHLEVEFVPAGVGGLQVERYGTLAHLRAPVADDAVATAFAAALLSLGRPPARGVLRMTSTIPVARGLGSSAAATVAGLVLARAAAGVAIDASDLLETATRIEGHPDNAAPALYGGLVGVARTGASVMAFPLALSDRIGFAWAAPPVEVSTAHARRVLPERLDYAVAVRSLSRLASLIHGLASGDERLLRAGFEDEMHVPHRLPLIPAASAVIESARAAGAWAVTISGSGSGLLAVTPKGTESAVATAMAGAFAAELPGWTTDAADPANHIIAYAAVPATQGACVLVQDGYEAVASLETP